MPFLSHQQKLEIGGLKTAVRTMTYRINWQRGILGRLPVTHYFSGIFSSWNHCIAPCIQIWTAHLETWFCMLATFQSITLPLKENLDSQLPPTLFPNTLINIMCIQKAHFNERCSAENQAPLWPSQGISDHLQGLRTHQRHRWCAPNVQRNRDLLNDKTSVDRIWFSQT